jgi:hypothetical protein
MYDGHPHMNTYHVKRNICILTTWSVSDLRKEYDMLRPRSRFILRYKTITFIHCNDVLDLSGHASYTHNFSKIVPDKSI